MVKNIRAFSLIELLVTIGILSILAVLGITNFVPALEKSRDARRKSDLSTIQKGLEAYYNDQGSYPTSGIGATTTKLCGNGFTTTAGCTGAVYLSNVPKDPKGGSYNYVVGNVSGTNQSFIIYSALERSDDTSPGVNQAGYNNGCDGPCKYAVSSTNTTP